MTKENSQKVGNSVYARPTNDNYIKVKIVPHFHQKYKKINTPSKSYICQ